MNFANKYNPCLPAFGCVWICYFKPDVLKQGLDLPENILALGYSAEPEADKDRHSQTRIPMEELVQYK